MEKRRENGLKKSALSCTLIFFVLTIVCVVFSTLVFFNSAKPFFVRHATLISALTAAFFCLLCGFCVWLTLKGKEVLSKTLLSVYIFAAFCLILCYILQKTGFFTVIRDAESLQKYLENAGAWMPLLYILLQYLQVVVLPIPGIVSTVAGVALFGSFWAMIYSLIGIVLGSLTAFLIGRKLGNKAVSWMVGEETLKKWQKKLKGKDNLFLTLMFLLPLFPDDVLCFIAGLSTMSFGYFTGMIVVSRVLAISATCYSFDFIPFNTWWGLLIWGVLIAVIAVGFILVYKNLDRIQSVLSKRFKVFRKKNK